MRFPKVAECPGSPAVLPNFSPQSPMTEAVTRRVRRQSAAEPTFIFSPENKAAQLVGLRCISGGVRAASCFSRTEIGQRRVPNIR